MTERERKLPKWAQAELRNARRAHHELLLMLEEKQEPTDTVIVRYEQPTRTLGRGESVRFYTGGADWNPDDEWQGEHIDVRVEHGELQLMGSDSLRITPQSSNVVRVRSLR